MIRIEEGETAAGLLAGLLELLFRLLRELLLMLSLVQLPELWLKLFLDNRLICKAVASTLVCRLVQPTDAKNLWLFAPA